MKCRNEAQFRSIIERGLVDWLELRELEESGFVVIANLKSGDRLVVATTNNPKVKVWKRLDYLWPHVKNEYPTVVDVRIKAYKPGDEAPICTLDPDDY